MRHAIALLFVLLCSASCFADDSLYVYKRFFVETYHINKHCPVIAGKKVIAYSLSDETDARTKMRNAIQLADPCEVCKTPNIRNTRDNRLEEVLANVLGSSVGSYDDDDEEGEAEEIMFNDASYFDDEVIVGLPEKGKVTSSVYRKVGHRFKMLEVKRAIEDRLVGCPVTCEVVKTRRSNFFGTEGELVVRPLYITADDGTIIRVKHDDIAIRGKNRQNLKFWTAWSLVTWFIPGGGAKVTAEDQFVVTLDPTADSAADGMIKAELEKKRAEEEAKLKAKEALKSLMESTNADGAGE